MNPQNPLNNVRIVLNHSSHPGNIGASARAMKTMGLSSLVLVNPGRFPDREAEALASGALDVLAAARVCASLDDALAGTVLAAALTARSRELSHTAYYAKQAARVLLEQARQHPVALVFGGEASGLSNEEIIKCQMLVHIPANPDYASLNLAAAVQVMCYELRMAFENLAPQPSEFEAASFEEIEMFFRHLEEVMVSTGYLNPDQPKRLMQRLRRLFARARLEKEEVKEPLIKSSADCVAGKMRMDARRATKVVAKTTTPRSATTHTPHFAATRTGRGFPGGLLCRSACQGGLPLASPRFAHSIPERRRRNCVGLNQRFLNILRGILKAFSKIVD